MLVISEKYTEIAYRLIKTIPALQYIKDSAVSIVCLSSNDEKKKNYKIVYADCRKVSSQYSWCCPFDFMITIYEPNIALFDDKQIEILIYHELQHVGILNDGNEPKYYLVPHDIEEFWTIINEYGLEWDKVREE